jgi:hypothetical protein
MEDYRAQLTVVLPCGNQKSVEPRNYGRLNALIIGLGGLEPPTSRLSGVRSNQAELQAPRQAGNITGSGPLLNPAVPGLGVGPGVARNGGWNALAGARRRRVNRKDA